MYKMQCLFKYIIIQSLIVFDIQELQTRKCNTYKL